MSKQYNWLKEELETKINRSLTPWVIVIIHCPIYNTFKFHRNDPQPEAQKKHLEPLFVQYRVNFVLSGHIHAYMRTKPVAFDKVTSTGPIHIILGNGGRNSNAPYDNPTPEAWVDVRDHATYGYGTLEFINATTALYAWIHTGFMEKEEQPVEGVKYYPNENLTDVCAFENQLFLLDEMNEEGQDEQYQIAKDVTEQKHQEITKVQSGEDQIGKDQEQEEEDATRNLKRNNLRK